MWSTILTRHEAIDIIHGLDGRFIRCGKDKLPIEDAGFFRRDPIPADWAKAHIDSGLNLAIEPRSVRCGALDFDGSKALSAEDSYERSRAACQYMVEFLGTDFLIGQFRSMSGYGLHAWWQIDTARPYPLGRKKDGTRYFMANCLYTNPLDKATKFDVRCKHSYVVCTHYLTEIAHRAPRQSHVQWRRSGMEQRHRMVLPGQAQVRTRT